ncbi:5'-nucleotidase C-terminal domain-containing protein [Dyadobacter crusticola]|uniref:5'-nucleotidase C-terminal domain-containing protein n=1 Tax=Dyadobacter crusticola TaxID=292407 RepID=UPI0009FE500C|nr:5'-nucleotidase [Dyadobacter crusticola]
MTSSNQERKGLYILLLTTLFLASCQKHLTVSSSDYKQYSIDQQSGEDSSMVKYYLPYKQKMQAEMSRVVGQAEQALTKPGNPETLLGNFFADFMLAEGLKREPSIQFALATKGGLRTTWPQGNITVSNVFELMPFENEMVVLKLNGENVQELADFVAKKGGQPVAGMRMKIKDGKAMDIEIAGQPFDQNKTYVLVTYDYLADGGDELDFLKKVVERRDIGTKVRDALLDYINELTRQGKKINAQLDGRITIVNE